MFGACLLLKRNKPSHRYGIYNMVGNVWEWVEGGSDKERPIRGGSYIDTVDGSANHALRVSV